MRKILLSLSIVLLFGLYSFFFSGKLNKTNIIRNEPFDKNNGNELSGDTAIPGLSTSTKSANKGRFKDGLYTGSIEDVYYGNVQIQAKITDGYISDIAFLQFPNTRGNSQKINNEAIPILRSEAIKVQSGDVDIVSGATQTSKGFIKSLNNALSMAQK